MSAVEESVSRRSRMLRRVLSPVSRSRRDRCSHHNLDASKEGPLGPLRSDLIVHPVLPPAVHITFFSRDDSHPSSKETVVTTNV